MKIRAINWEWYGAVPTGDDAAGINYKEEEDCSHVKLPDEQTKAALLAAYQKELML